MTPIVRLIAHTTFLGVPLDLLPTDKATQLQAKRFVEADTICKDNNQKRPERTSFFRQEAIESEARRFVNEAKQDRGTDAERLVECAGRACYDSYGNGRDSEAYHQHILDVNHGSVMEHTNFTFFLGNISRGCTHELVRHRVGIAISQRSTRYVDENTSEWALHPLVDAYFASGSDVADKAPNGEATETTLRQRTDYAIKAAKDGYRDTVEDLQIWLIRRGVDKFTARKQARGAARGLLGNALATEMVWTCNLRALRGIIDQRVKAAADAEIRILFGRIWEEAFRLAPAYLQYDKRSCPDGLGFELYDPKAPAEKLKNAEIEVQRLRERLAEVTSDVRN